MGRHLLTAAVATTAASPPTIRRRPHLHLPSEAALRLTVASTAYAVLVTFASLAAIAILLAVVGGLRPVAISSSSMAPSLRSGDLVLVDPDVSPATGDIAAFRSSTPDRRIITHRVSAVDADGLHTRGDANASEDPWTVPPDDAIGTARVVVPLIGTPGAWVETRDRVGLVVLAVCAIALVWSAAELRDPGPARRRQRGRTVVARIEAAARGLLRTSAVLAVVVAALATRPATAAFASSTFTTGDFASPTLTAPTNVSATASCDVILLGPKITVTWDAVTGAATYDVERATSGAGPFSSIATPATNSYEDTSVAGLTTYYYRVTAVAGSWTGPVSATASDTTGLCL